MLIPLHADNSFNSILFESRGSKPDGTIGGEKQTRCHLSSMACFTSRLWHCVTPGVMYLEGYDLSQGKFHAPSVDCAPRYLAPFTHQCAKPITGDHISEGNVMETLIPLWFDSLYSVDMRFAGGIRCSSATPLKAQPRHFSMEDWLLPLAKLTVDEVLSRPLCDLGLGFLPVFYLFLNGMSEHGALLQHWLSIGGKSTYVSANNVATTLPSPFPGDPHLPRQVGPICETKCCNLNSNI